MEIRLSKLENTETIRKLVRENKIISPEPLCKTITLLIKGLSLEYADKKWKLHLSDRFVRYYKYQSEGVTSLVYHTFTSLIGELSTSHRNYIKNHIKPEDLTTTLISSYTQLVALDRIIDQITLDRESIQTDMTFKCEKLENIVMSHSNDKQLTFHFDAKETNTSKAENK